MRNATTFDDDSFEEPARKSTRKPRGAAKKKGKRFHVEMTKVARYAAIGMTAAVGIGIVVNALMMQKGHHPAPLFGPSTALVEPAPAPKVALPTKTARSDVAPRAEPDDSTAAIPVPPLKPHREASLKASGDDPIARLLKTGTLPAASGEKSDVKTVLGVQQALVKLGYVLKPNGTLGPATKKAIELFEKDRHLPIKSELSHRLVKIISAESGVKID